MSERQRTDPEFTEQQSLGGRHRSEQLSLHAATRPSNIPGFKVDKLIGQGAFGQVWRGRDLNTGRQVAIKFYLHGSSVNWTLLREEVKHLVNMSTGRYIVQVLMVGWDAEPPYYVMEYLENGSLGDLIRERGELGVAETVAIVREIAEGLSYAHSKGVLHCDLKPANILLDHSLRPRLADFGQSRLATDQTPSLGTLFFMAPEQADLQASPDAAWDVYALGAIAYSMLVGSPPYRTPEIVEKLDTAGPLPERLHYYQQAIRTTPLAPLHYRRRGVDKRLCQIIDRCLEPNPQQRYHNVQQVIAAIDSRNQARVRRPVVLMGVLGPLLLLSLMILFSNRSISIAKQESLERVQDLSLRGNLQTAKYARSTMESEIKSLFKLIEREANRKELAERLGLAVDGAEPLLSEIHTLSLSPPELERFRELENNRSLKTYVETRLKLLVASEGNGRGVAIFNSLFINDARGTNMAIAYANPEEEADSPIGRNFAYRSYFNGQREDGDRGSPPSSFLPTRSPHFSASFRSTSTGKWKLGISAPIWPASQMELLDAGQAPSDAVQPLGVLVLTVNLGDFVLLGDVPAGDAQFTTLVDGRSGTQRGTLLQHPLLGAMDKETMRTSRMPQMSIPQLERLMNSDGIVDYQDPAAEFPGGQRFAGTWIASMAQVHLPQPSASSHRATQSTSDLWALVQEKGDVVSAPVNELGNRLQAENYKIIGVTVFLVLCVWFVVFRYGPVFIASVLRKARLEPFGNPTLNSELEQTTRSDR